MANHSIYACLFGALLCSRVEAQELAQIGTFSWGVYTNSLVEEPVDWNFAVTALGELIVSKEGPPDLLPSLLTDPIFAGANPLVGVSTYSSATGFADARDYAALDGDVNLLLAGVDALGVGRVEFWSYDLPLDEVQLVSSQAYAGKYVAGVAYDAAQAKLYLLDSVSNSILEATWVPGVALPDSASFQVWATELDVPELSEADRSYIRFVKGGAGDLPSGPGQLFLGEQAEVFGEGLFVTGSIGSIVSTPGIWYVPASPGGPSARELTFAEGDTVVSIRGDSGEVVGVKSLQGAVLGTATIPMAANDVNVVLSTALVAGDQYTVYYPNLPQRPVTFFDCVPRYGLPETTSYGLEFLGRWPDEGCYIGNDEFSTQVHVAMSPPPPAAGQPLVGIWMLGAFRGPGGIDPLVPNPWGGGLVLNPVSISDAYGFVYGNGSGYMALDIPIPNTPGLVGQILLTQFAAIDVLGLKFSETIGQMIREL